MYRFRNSLLALIVLVSFTIVAFAQNETDENNTYFYYIDKSEDMDYLHIVDIRHNQDLQQIPIPKHDFYALSRDGRYLAMGTEDEYPSILNTITGQIVQLDIPFSPEVGILYDRKQFNQGSFVWSSQDILGFTGQESDNERQIFTYDPAENNVDKINTTMLPGNSGLTISSWSPDGTSLTVTGAYERTNELAPGYFSWLIDIQGARSVELSQDLWSCRVIWNSAGNSFATDADCNTPAFSSSFAYVFHLDQSDPYLSISTEVLDFARDVSGKYRVLSWRDNQDLLLYKRSSSQSDALTQNDPQEQFVIYQNDQVVPVRNMSESVLDNSWIYQNDFLLSTINRDLIIFKIVEDEVSRYKQVSLNTGCSRPAFQNPPLISSSGNRVAQQFACEPDYESVLEIINLNVLETEFEARDGNFKLLGFKSREITVRD